MGKDNVRSMSWKRSIRWALHVQDFPLSERLCLGILIFVPSSSSLIVHLIVIKNKEVAYFNFLFVMFLKLHYHHEYTSSSTLTIIQGRCSVNFIEASKNCPSSLIAYWLSFRNMKWLVLCFFRHFFWLRIFK